MPNETVNKEAADGVGNLAFYRMCADFPDHRDENVVWQKVLFIARVYSVSRGLGGKWDALSKALVKHADKLDRKLAKARRLPFGVNMESVLKCHNFLDKLVCETIRGEARNVHGRASFTSKYLHFHAPDSFPILDQHALRGLQSLTAECPGYRADGPPYERFCKRFEYYLHSMGTQKESLRQIDTRLVDIGKQLSEAAQSTGQNGRSSLSGQQRAR